VQIKNVGGTHFCDIFIKQKGLILHIESVIDNLLRGASSSAVVNANLMLGIDEYIGIPDIAYAP
jgi:N-acetyl-gamma-glutamyl-phosphate reductase